VKDAFTDFKSIQAEWKDFMADWGTGRPLERCRAEGAEKSIAMRCNGVSSFEPAPSADSFPQRDYASGLTVSVSVRHACTSARRQFSPARASANADSIESCGKRSIVVTAQAAHDALSIALYQPTPKPIVAPLSPCANAPLNVTVARSLMARW
jgi:hypothetical protein